MGRQRKNLFMLIAAVLVIGGLAGVYFWQEHTARQIPAAETDPLDLLAGNIILIDRAEEDIVSVRFTNNDGHDLTLFSATDEYGDIIWAIEEVPDAPIIQSSAREMVRAFHYLSAEAQVFEVVENPADFGIGANITATATYTDGSRNTIFVGSLTPAHDRFYMMLEGDPGLYLLYTYFGNRYLNTADDLYDRNLPHIVLDGAEYLLISERGTEPIEFAFDGTEEEKQEMYEKYGMVVINMVTPHPGRELYYQSLEMHVMNTFSENFRLGELIELFPESYASYGLDDPSLEFKYIGIHGIDEIHLLFGDRTDDGLIYVKQAHRPEVFTASYEAVRAMYGVNPFRFIERFIALIDIQHVENIQISYSSDPSRTLDMVINHDFQPPDDNWPNGRDIMFPTINGRDVEESEFKAVYRLLIGLTSDVEIEPFEPTDAPTFTVTFNMRDGRDAVHVAYHLYEANFFAMSRDGGPCVLVTSRHATDVFFNAVAELLGR
jgi:hypothetical protein